MQNKDNYVFVDSIKNSFNPVTLTGEEVSDILLYLEETDQNAFILCEDEDAELFKGNPRVDFVSHDLLLSEKIQILRDSNEFIGLYGAFSLLAKNFNMRATVKCTQAELDKYNTEENLSLTLDIFKTDPIITSGSPTEFNDLYMKSSELEIVFQKDMRKKIKYESNYWQNYINLAGSVIANKLNDFRVSFVEKYLPNHGSVLDIGIGSGEFINSSKNRKVYGFDVNPYGIEWLKEKNLYFNPYEKNQPNDIAAYTFWDAIEHFTNPSHLLNIIKKDSYCFFSLPIFENFDKLTESKHYKPNEHLYYWTEQSFKDYLNRLGFSVLEVSNGETEAGRFGIKSFVAKK